MREEERKIILLKKNLPSSLSFELINSLCESSILFFVVLIKLLSQINEITLHDNDKKKKKAYGTCVALSVIIFDCYMESQCNPY